MTAIGSTTRASRSIQSTSPGWRVMIDVAETELQGQPFATVEENYEHETNWLCCWVEDGKFQAAGGPLMLSPMPRIFLDRAAQHSSHSEPPD